MFTCPNSCEVKEFRIAARLPLTLIPAGKKPIKQDTVINITVGEDGLGLRLTDDDTVIMPKWVDEWAQAYSEGTCQSCDTLCLWQDVETDSTLAEDQAADIVASMPEDLSLIPLIPSITDFTNYKLMHAVVHVLIPVPSDTEDTQMAANEQLTSMMSAINPAVLDWVFHHDSNDEFDELELPLNPSGGYEQGTFIAEVRPELYSNTNEALRAVS